MKRKSAAAGLMWDEICISAPPHDPHGSPEEHNGGMTRFCGRLIILDTHVHSDTHFSTRAWAVDANTRHVHRNTHTHAREETL